VRGLDGRRRDVTLGIKPDSSKRTIFSMRAGQEREIMRDDWSGNGNVATVFQVPELATVVQIVSGNIFPTVTNDLRAAIGNGNGRGAPGSAGFFAGHAPK